MASSSSSEADNDPSSSPIAFKHQATDTESDNCQPSSSQESNQSRSLQSSPRSKRRRYELYLEDPSIEIPRETQRRWTHAATNAILASSSAKSPSEAESSKPSSCQDIESSHSSPKADNAIDSDSSTEAEVESSASELEHDHHGESEQSSNSESESEENCYSVAPNSEDSPTAVNHPDNESVCSSSNSGSGLLFRGSTKTTDEAVLGVCQLFLKHRWSKVSLDGTLKLMADTLPKPNNMPHSLAVLYKYLNLESLPCLPKPHFYCSGCLELKASQSAVCADCHSDKSGVFFYFSIADQIKYFFESDNLSRAIDDYQSVRSRDIDPQNSTICDILDGSEYKRVKNYATGRYDIVLAWNTDGVSLVDGTDVKLYPLLSTICEVSPRLRLYYLAVNSIWVDVSAPIMSLFLKPFAEELTEIYEAGGVQWTHPDTGEIITSRVVAPLFIGDAPVRGDALRVMRYNAVRGCEKCEEKAVKLPPKDGKGRSLRRFVYKETPARERTKERMRLQGQHAESQMKKHVKGVKGRSVVDDIPLLDRACCTLAEYMHCVLLGVTRQFSLLWFCTQGPWYIGKCTKAVDEFILSIKVLDCMRIPKKVSKLVKFKASELRSWLLFFSLPVLQEAQIPDAYFQHWILFVKSIYLLLQDEISESDLQCAEIMLRCFLRDIGKLYSNYEYVYNRVDRKKLFFDFRKWVVRKSCLWWH